MLALFWSQPFITVQGSIADVSALLKASDNDSKKMRQIPQTKIKDALQLHRKHFNKYMILRQPYELKDDNVDYIANDIRPVCFISVTSTQLAKEDMLSQGISFHMSYKGKVGLVLRMTYQGKSHEDFENHLRAHLKCTLEYILSGSEKVFHMFINFSRHLHFQKIYEVLFRNGLRPGVFKEGFFVTEKSNAIANMPKL